MQEDVPEVFALEQTTLSPWTSAMLCSELEMSGSRQLLALAPSGGVVGWCCCRLVPPEAELLKITVEEGARRSGIGSCLFNSICQELKKNQISMLFLEVRRLNGTALRFYKENSFRQVGLRPNYYSNPSDDAYILQYELSPESTENDLI